MGWRELEFERTEMTHMVVQVASRSVLVLFV
jgi:hypothetical protein